MDEYLNFISENIKQTINYILQDNEIFADAFMFDTDFRSGESLRIDFFVSKHLNDLIIDEIKVKTNLIDCDWFYFVTSNVGFPYKCSIYNENFKADRINYFRNKYFKELLNESE